MPDNSGRPRLTPARRRLLDQLLDHLLELDEIKREREVDAIATRTPRIHGWLIELLAASTEPTGFLDTIFERVGQAAVQDAHSRQEVRLPQGTRLGPWRIEEAVGSGGMGTVYRAGRADGAFEMDAAVKLIRLRRPALDQQLAIERQLLARLSHRNIARLIDGGTTEDGHAYLVMEWIPGRDLDAYISDQKSDVAARLDLFAQMAAAVSHAHQRRIVHGDLKPGNVRITDEGSVRLVDFGVARLLVEGELDDEPLRALTPAFAAPEVLNGEPVSTQSDVWSLGAILYWLLSGSVMPSEEGALDGAALAPEISRREDLLAIIARASAEETARRYATVSGLVEDLERYRRRFPVKARAPSRRYFLERFIQRHRLVVASAGAATLLLLVALAGAVWQAQQATLERDRAEAETERALQAEAESTQLALEMEQVVAFQAEQFSRIDMRQMGSGLRSAIAERHEASMKREGISVDSLQPRQAAAEQVLARINFTDLARDTLDDNIFSGALEAIDEQFSNQPLVRARLLQTVASTLRGLGMTERARAPQSEALAIRREWLGDDHPDTLDTINRMGRQLAREGQHERALARYREALTGQEAAHGRDHPATLTAMNNMGTALEAMGRYTAAESYFRDALRGRRILLGNGHSDTLISISNLAAILDSLGRPEEAIGYYREALELRRELLGNDHPATLRSINNLGAFLAGENRFDEAEPYYREALERRRRVLGREHPQTLNSTNNMGYLLINTDRREQAEGYYREAVSISRRVRGDDHPLTLVSINNLAHLLHQLSRYETAERLAAEAVSRGRRSLPSGHWYLGVFLTRQGRELAALERYDDAVAAMREAHEVLVESLGAEHEHTQVTVDALAEVFSRWHEVEPDSGHDGRAAGWKRRLADHREEARGP